MYPKRIQHDIFPFLFLLAALLAASTAGAARAQHVGDLTVTPTRVVFEGRSRSAQISLINRGDAAATYRISFIQLRMDEQGGFEEITEPGPGEKFADTMIRYSPRQVHLEPGAAQTVRLMLRKAADLPDGEYRSHLLLHAVPPEDTGMSLEETALEDDQLGIRLIPIYRISVPVIVCHGEISAEVELAEVALRRGGEDGLGGEDGPPTLAVRVERRGERSIHGDLSVTWTPPDGGEAVVSSGSMRVRSVMT